MLLAVEKYQVVKWLSEGERGIGPRWMAEGGDFLYKCLTLLTVKLFNWKLCFADAIHNFKWVKIIQVDKIEVNGFEILLIGVTFYL